MLWECQKYSLSRVVGGLLDDLAVNLISQKLLFLPQLNRWDQFFLKSQRVTWKLQKSRRLNEHWPVKCGSSSLSGCYSSSLACHPWTASRLEGQRDGRRSGGMNRGGLSVHLHASCRRTHWRSTRQTSCWFQDRCREWGTRVWEPGWTEPTQSMVMDAVTHNSLLAKGKM